MSAKPEAPVITVREVRDSDFAAWRDLFLQYIAFYEADVPEATLRLTWERVLNKADGMIGFIAEDAGRRPVGIAMAVFHRSTWSPTWYCYLEDLFVAPAARGRGAGRALIEAVYAEADCRDATRTYWATATSNATARKLYDGIGHLAPFVQYRR
jgi:GNAT superfamily N-acetyltransferase